MVSNFAQADFGLIVARVEASYLIEKNIKVIPYVKLYDFLEKWIKD
jgi:hypothetical protein